jgi:hypothetical protein
VLKDWACECIFFFNYNRINAGVGPIRSSAPVSIRRVALLGAIR